MSEIKFGIIGCGEVAVDTCLAIAAAPNASVAMLMYTRPEVLQDLAEVYGAPTTTDVDEVLANPELDAVYVATPHDLHVPIGLKAAAAGKHILMEKPIATNLRDADALIEACQRAGVRLGVAFYAQTDDVLTYTRGMVRGGLLGDLIAVRCGITSDKPASYWQAGYTQRVRTDWRASKARAGGGVLMMNIVHDFNTLRWVTGLEAKRVYAEMDTLVTPVEVEDTIGVVIRYYNGAIGTVHAGSAFPGGAHLDARGPRVYGTKGQLILSPPVMAYLQEPAEGSVANAWQEVKVANARGGRQAMVEGFVDAVLRGQDPPCSGQDGRKALELVLAAYASAERGQPVTLPL